MNSKEEVIRKVLEGETNVEQLSSEEKSLFEGPAEVAEMEKILQTTADWEAPTRDDIDSNWQTLLSKIEKEEAPVRRLYWLPVAAAITVLFVVGYLIWAPAGMVTIQTTAGEFRELILPDNSRVILNAGSQLSYSEDWNRRVELEGMARFVVTEGQEFVVASGQYETAVLGTEFDVDYQGKAIEVSCYSGEVSVSIGNERQHLTAGERATSRGERLVETRFDTEASGKWVSGEFYFDNVPFGEVVAELQRQFGLEVSGLNDDSRPYKGYFFKDDLEEALELVFQPMGYEYTLDNKKLIIK